MIIRNIRPGDVPVLMQLGSEMHQESIYRDLDFDSGKLLHLAHEILTGDIYCCFVAEEDDEIAGLIVGYVVEHYFGHDLTSGDLLVYVAPEHRGSSAGPRLIRAYTDWCEQKGVKMPCLGVSAGINQERIGALYQKLGYTDKYIIYRKPMR